jgi:hypothetical protein
MSRYPAPLFLLADHRERELLAEVARARCAAEALAVPKTGPVAGRCGRLASEVAARVAALARWGAPTAVGEPRVANAHE